MKKLKDFTIKLHTSKKTIELDILTNVPEHMLMNAVINWEARTNEFTS